MPITSNLFICISPFLFFYIQNTIKQIPPSLLKTVVHKLFPSVIIIVTLIHDYQSLNICNFTYINI